MCVRERVCARRSSRAAVAVEAARRRPSVAVGASDATSARLARVCTSFDLAQLCLKKKATEEPELRKSFVLVVTSPLYLIL